MGKQAPTMRLKLCLMGVELIYTANESIFFRHADHHSWKLVSRVFLQGEIESIAHMKFEDLPGSKSVVVHDVPVVLLGDDVAQFNPLSDFMPLILTTHVQPPCRHSPSHPSSVVLGPQNSCRQTRRPWIAWIRLIVSSAIPPTSCTVKYISTRIRGESIPSLS